MVPNLSKKVTPGELILTIVLMALLAVFSVFFVRNILMAKKTGVFQDHRPITNLLLSNKKTNQTSVNDIEYIDSWMTFQYINFIFGMPNDYLKNTLAIEDVRYPNLPIGRYVKTKKLDSTTFLHQIKTATKTYLTTHPSK